MPVAIWAVLKWSVNLNDDTNLDLESVSRGTFPPIPSDDRFPFAGSVRAQLAVHRLPLRIFAGRVRTGVGPVDHPDFIPPVAARADRRVPVRIRSHQHSSAVAQALQIFFHPGHRDCVGSFLAGRWLHALLLSCSGVGCSRQGNRLKPSSSERHRLRNFHVKNLNLRK